MDQEALTWMARFSLRGRPVMLTRTFVPPELVPDTCAAKDEAAPRRLTVLLSDLGLSAADGVVETRGRAPSAEDCDLLEIPVGRFVLDSRVTLWDGQLRPLAVEQTVMDTAAFVLVNTINLDEAR